MDFLNEFVRESLEFIFLIIVAVGGAFAGIALRKHKDKKSSDVSAEDKQ